MNRYMITREKIKGQEYLISALYDEKKHMIEVLPEAAGETSLLGNIYVGKVENIVTNLNAAFVKIAPDIRCYLPLSDVKNPVFTRKLSQTKALAAGDELLVQVSREALKTKDPAVTTNLAIAGTYAVLTSGNRKKSVSSKVKGEARERLVKLVEQTAGEYGVILRTNAAEASDEAVLLELEVLSERYETMAEAAAHKNCYTLVYREEAGWLRHIRDLRKDDLEEIVTDDRGMFEDICSACRIHKQALTTGGSVPVPVDDVMTADGIRIRYYKDPSLSLGALYSVRAELKNALSERVWLKSGAYLVIQPTEALTVVDVNTGKNVAKKEMQENFLRVNKEAAEEIARQLRLRNLSGMVLVDFINLISKSAEEELLKTFRAALQKDPVPAQLIDMTALGLVEVTRKKIKRPLHEIFPDGLGF